MRNVKKISFALILVLISLFLAGIWSYKKFNLSSAFQDNEIGQAIDSLNGVKVYYNGHVNNVSGRNLTKDNYNLGKKYQCVEFVKRYYYEHLNHKMPDSYGNAKDFFDSSLKDGEVNKKRGLKQFTNPSESKPQVNDLIILGATTSNKYGHVAIISGVNETEIEMIQQNPGKYGKSRILIPISYTNSCWRIENDRIMGWLRKDI